MERPRHFRSLHLWKPDINITKLIHFYTSKNIMTYRYTRNYIGPLQLAVFDWAGTIVDFGCCAPTAAFIDGFKKQGVSITTVQAREPMGMEKRAHIKTVTEMEEVAREWQRVHGRPVTEGDIDRMFDDFVPVLLDVLGDHSSVIPGVVDAVTALRKNGMKIAGSTGYFKEAADISAKCAAIEGYVPDFTISASEVPAGRPFPWMIYRAMEALEVCPPEAVVNVGDTVMDIQAGLNAGCWTIGIARSGNETGLSLSEINRSELAEVETRVVAARKKLLEAGAHYVIDSVAEIEAVVDIINTRLTKGEKP